MKVEEYNRAVDLARRILEKISIEAGDQEIEMLVERLQGPVLRSSLKAFALFFQRNGWTQGIVNEGFITLLVGLTDWKILLREPVNIASVVAIVSALCRREDMRSLLLGNRMAGAVMDVVDAEAEIEELGEQDSKAPGLKNASHLLSELVPIVRDSSCCDDADKIHPGILRSGPRGGDSSEASLNTLYVLSFTLGRFVNIRTKYGSTLIHYVLLLKMVYWACKIDVLTDVVDVADLVDLLKIGLTSGCQSTITVCLATVNILKKKHLRALRRSDLGEVVSKLVLIREHRWIEGVREALAIVWPVKKSDLRYMKKYVTLVKQKDPAVQSREEIVKIFLDFILSDQEENLPYESLLSLRYTKLTTLMEIVLDVPRASARAVKLAFGPARREVFKSLVVYVNEAVDEAGVKYYPDAVAEDLHYEELFLRAPESPDEVRLGLRRTAQLDRVLGTSRSPILLSLNPLVKALRLLSILQVANEDWGALFSTLSTGPLIDRRYFASNYLEMRAFKKLSEIEPEPFPLELAEIFKQYPGLISPYARKEVYKIKKNIREVELSNTYQQFEEIVVPRRGLVESLADQLEPLNQPEVYWSFAFCDEMGKGFGVTKDVYTEFSRDCQRHDLNLWLGEPTQNSDGIVYVRSECGLFPRPRTSISPKAITAIGRMLAKSILDDNLLDFNFSRAFYKCVFGPHAGFLNKTKVADVQQLTLQDLKDIDGPTFKFVQSLIEALKKKWIIENDLDISEEEMEEAISAIQFDGCSFEDLCVNFTLPGCPDVEMKEKGRFEMLTINNAEEYLTLLVWWMLYKGPQDVLKRVRESIQDFLPLDLFESFCPEEIERKLCGLRKENWPLDYLWQNCSLENMTPDEPILLHLFEVMSSLSEKRQQQFLRFVTGSPRLPANGLKGLTPQLTVRKINVNGDPDDYLPSAMACTNSLFVPSYSAKEVLERKLWLAIGEGTNSFEFA